MSSSWPVPSLLIASWHTFKGKWKDLLSIELQKLIAILVIVSVAVVALIASGSLNWLIAGLIIVIGLIAVLVVSSWFSVASINVLIGQQQPVKSAWPLMAGMVLVQLLVFVSVLLGSILLIIPAIVVGIWCSQAGYVYVLEGIKGYAALKRSRQLVKGHWWGVLGRILLVYVPVVSITALLQSNVASTVISLGFSLYVACYNYHLYLALKEAQPKTE